MPSVLQNILPINAFTNVLHSFVAGNKLDCCKKYFRTKSKVQTAENSCSYTETSKRFGLPNIIGVILVINAKI